MLALEEQRAACSLKRARHWKSLDHQEACFGSSKRRRHGLRCNGIFTLDALLGLAMIVVIAGGLGAVVSTQQRAAIAAADRRAAIREAEAALTARQFHQPVAGDVTIKPLSASAPAGWMWVEATCRSGSHGVVLTGLAPADGGRR